MQRLYLPHKVDKSSAVRFSATQWYSR